MYFKQRVIFCCGADPVFEFLSSYYGDPLFDVVIVDEASQLTEPMTLAAINHAKRFVLVGDHRQLPPPLCKANRP